MLLLILFLCPDLAAVDGSVESSFFTQVRDAQAVACGDLWEQLKKMRSACEHGFIFCGALLCYTKSGIEVSLVIPEDAGL